MQKREKWMATENTVSQTIQQEWNMDSDSDKQT